MKRTITKNVLVAGLAMATSFLQAQTVSTVVGVRRSNIDAQTIAPFDNSSTTPSAARLVVPNGIAFDLNGKMYFSEWHKIRIVDGTTVANRGGEPGDPNFTRAFWDAAGIQAKMSEPAGMIVYSNNELYFADEDNHAIRKMSQFSNLGNTQFTTTVAGDYSAASSLNGVGVAGTTDGTGLAAKFNRPSDLAVDKDGYIYVCDKFNNSIRRIQFVGSDAVVTTFAGLTGEFNTGTTDGVGTAARFNTPSSITYDATTHTLIVADWGNGSLRKIDIATKTVSTLLPNNTMTAGYADGALAVANAHQPFGVCVDGAGNIFFTERQRCVVRKISTDGIVSTVAGQDDVADWIDGDPTKSAFAGPERIVYNPGDEAFYITDWNNSVIRKMVMPGEADFSADATAGNTNTIFKFTDLSSGNPTDWAWSFSPPNELYVNGTGSNDQNPEVKFTSEGLYSVTLTIVTPGGQMDVTKTDYINVASAAGVSTLFSNGFEINVYPNPTAGNLTIGTAEVTLQKATIQVMDVSGRLVYQQLNINGTQVAIDLSGLTTGVYFVKVANEGKVAVKKIIIE